MYIRKVCYLDYLENDVRVGNVGYVKFCLHEGALALEVKIRGLPRTMDGRAQLRLIRTQKECEDAVGVLGIIEICDGNGGFRGGFDAENVDGNGNGFLEFSGMEIMLPSNGILWTGFGPEPERRAVKEPEKPAQNKYDTGNVIKSDEAQNSAVSEWIPDALDERLSVDKWEQLCRTHRQMHPFGDKIYISLTPRDFVILRKEYQQLVNNSFLLHGFYNYRHLILGKEAAKEEEIYYLGVPGTYYDREKMVAVMFGFEGFEASGTAEKQSEDTEGTTGPGTFGYYMKRVEI